MPAKSNAMSKVVLVFSRARGNEGWADVVPVPYQSVTVAVTWAECIIRRPSCVPFAPATSGDCCDSIGSRPALLGTRA